MTRQAKTLLALASTVTLFSAAASCSSPPLASEDDSGSTTFGPEGGSGDGTTGQADSGSPETGVIFHGDASEDGPYNVWPPGTGPIVYWGGPVLTGTPTVYFIFYGNWDGSKTPGILEYLIRNFSGSPYSKILTAYYQTPQAPVVDAGPDASSDADAAADAEAVFPTPVDASGLPKTYATGNFSFGGSTYVGYTQGTTIPMGGVESIVTAAIKAGSLPLTSDSVYYVLTSADVTETMDGYDYFCDSYCGYHSPMTVEGTPIEYAFVGDPSSCLSDCTVVGGLETDGFAQPPSPNGDWGADGMASVMIHELCESTTDPAVEINDAWLDFTMSSEIGDMCAWRFEPVEFSKTGAPHNVTLGSRDFLIQQMWVNEGDAGGCALHP